MRELTLPTPLVLLPGMGADGAMFAHQRKAFGDDAVIVPPWLTPHDQEPFQVYARRLAERLSPTLPERYVLGGASFGGMLAQELLRFVDPQPSALLLISSARSARGVPNAARLIGKIAEWMPSSALGVLHQLMAVPFTKANDGDDEALRTMVGMAKRHDPALFKWTIQQASAWEGPVLPDGAAPPIYAIHGRRDPVLRCLPELCDVVIPDGKHLIHHTHSKTVNRWIFNHVVAVTPGADVDYPAIEDPDKTVARRAELAV